MVSPIGLSMSGVMEPRVNSRASAQVPSRTFCSAAARAGSPAPVVVMRPKLGCTGAPFPGAESPEVAAFWTSVSEVMPREYGVSSALCTGRPPPRGRK